LRGGSVRGLGGICGQAPEDVACCRHASGIRRICGQAPQDVASCKTRREGGVAYVRRQDPRRLWRPAVPVRACRQGREERRLPHSAPSQWRAPTNKCCPVDLTGVPLKKCNNVLLAGGLSTASLTSAIALSLLAAQLATFANGNATWAVRQDRALARTRLGPLPAVVPHPPGVVADVEWPPAAEYWAVVPAKVGSE
jgi:hypothetical protein